MILAKYPRLADLWSWVELLFINIFQVLHGLTSTPYVHSAAATMADGSYAAVDLDVMMQTAVVPLVEAAVVDVDTTDSQIGAIAYALVDNFFKVSAHSSRTLYYMAYTTHAFICFLKLCTCCGEQGT